MARKKRLKRARKAPSGPKELTTEALEGKAAEHLRAGLFKRAVADYKELLRRESTPRRVEGLAEAYAGRAEELAAKGMIPEALAILRNRAEICAKPLDDMRYLELLLASGELAKAVAWLNEHLPALSDSPKRLAEIRRVCAAPILGGVEALLVPWPEDDPLRKDLRNAELALEAYCADNDEALRGALKEIPYRSPFRELKMILSALLELHEAPDSALAQLRRIDDASPFQALVEAIRRALEGSAGADPKDPVQSFANTLMGRSPAMASAAADFARARGRGGDASGALFRLIVRHRQALGEGFALAACKRLVIQDDGEHDVLTTREFDRVFGQPEVFERYRLVALMKEQACEPAAERLEAWEKCLEQLASSRCYIGEDQTLARSLIYRRMADIAAADTFFEGELAEYLAKSVENDPGDREGYLRLIGVHRDAGRMKQARDVAARAEERWPDDAAIRIQSVRNAIASRAFKKAATISRKVLELDPVNSEVKGILLDAHLAHARKQIAAGKSHLSERELLQARDWASSEASRGRVNLLTGITAFVAGDKGAAKQPLKDGCDQLGPLAGRFILNLEAMGLGLDPKALMRAGGISQKPERLEPADLMDLLSELDRAKADPERRGFVHLALFGMVPVVKGAAKLELDESQYIRACETWRRHAQTRKALLSEYARRARSQFPHKPVFEFYVIESEVEKGERLGYRHRAHLHNLLDDAHSAGDNKLAHKITEMLIEDDRISGFGGLFGFDDDEDEDLWDEDPDEEGIDPFLGFEESGLALPRGMSEDDFLDMMIAEGIPPDIQSLVEQIGALFGIRDRREILRILFFGGADGLPGALPDMPFDPSPGGRKPKPKKKRGRNRR